MDKKKLFLNLIVVGMTLGTGWAIRGQFGHEQGAAWAGSLGALSILIIANREDWFQRLFKATLAAAIGWGLGGMMSYGRVVGYGRGVDFINVYYGLLMLFVIGGLYGFLGGGLFGLTLNDSSKNKVKWPLLLIGMTASGIITYFFMVMQWEWLMTPPRSEVWAVCLGMAFFFTWFTIQYKFNSALRVAVFAGLGGGFGFAFGNFLQVVGNTLEIPFNFWNVMEYSLGFFGGAGMAYGTFSSSWPKEEVNASKISNLIPLLLVVLFIPFVVWDQSFEAERITKTYEKLISGDMAAVSYVVQTAALLLILFLAGFTVLKYYVAKKENVLSCNQSEARTLLSAHFGVYIIFSLLITGAIVSTYRIEQYLYILNFGIILFVLPKLSPVFEVRETSFKRWSRNFIIVLLIIVVLAVIAINIHGEMPGMQKRFEF